MLPSIARSKELFINEQKYYEENKKQQKSIVQNLAKMQHDGIPTRLLDFTTDPLVALFFATQENERTDSSVYVFIRNGYSPTSREVKLSSFVATQKNRCLEDIVKNFNKSNDITIGIESAKEILSRGIFIRPDTINDDDNCRMHEQKGTFAISGNQIENGYITSIIPLGNDSSYEEIVVPFEYQEEIRNELEKKGYTRERLLGEEKKLIKYNELPKDNIREKKRKYKRGLYSNYSITLEMLNLMTVKEIKDRGYQIAKASKVDSVWIWFQRLNSEDGNNIITQHWYKESINEYGWKGKEYYEFMLEEIRGNSYISYAYFQSNFGRIKYKHLPIEDNAKLISLDVRLIDKNQLVIDTNLMKGTELLISYSVDGGLKREIKIIVKEQLIKIDIDTSHKFNTIEGNVTMPVSSVQPAEVRNVYGIDYEKIKGDFIERSDEDPLIFGYKEFKL